MSPSVQKYPTPAFSSDVFCSRQESRVGLLRPVLSLCSSRIGLGLKSDNLIWACMGPWASSLCALDWNPPTFLHLARWSATCNLIWFLFGTCTEDCYSCSFDPWYSPSMKCKSRVCLYPKAPLCLFSHTSSCQSSVYPLQGNLSCSYLTGKQSKSQVLAGGGPNFWGFHEAGSAWRCDYAF